MVIGRPGLFKKTGKTSHVTKWGVNVRAYVNVSTLQSGFMVANGRTFSKRAVTCLTSNLNINLNFRAFRYRTTQVHPAHTHFFVSLSLKQAD